MKKFLNFEVEYKDMNLTLGPSKKPMNVNWDFKTEIDLETGIKEVIECVKSQS